MGVLLVPPIVLAGIIAVVVLAARSGPGRSRRRAVVGVTGAVLVLLAPWPAMAVAEGRTGWIDTDGDGVLDGFVNGAYDWVDLVGGTWAATTAVLVAAAVVGAWVALRWRGAGGGSAGLSSPRR